MAELLAQWLNEEVGLSKVSQLPNQISGALKAVLIMHTRLMLVLSDVCPTFLCMRFSDPPSMPVDCF